MRKKSYLTVTDQFCGAGGSSQGVRKFATRTGLGNGLEVKLALNHWQLAIDTHNTNFPDAHHECTDVSACDPRRYMPTDILITSPECTNHTVANGKKRLKRQMDMFATGQIDPAAERSRATMWDVPRFAEVHNYNIIIVENVVDARHWIMFAAWIAAMYAMDYLHKCVYLNSMFCHPTPQSRDRMYVVFWKRGNKAPKLDFMPPAYCPKCECNVNAIQTWKKPTLPYGKYGGNGQYFYSCPTCSIEVKPYYFAAFNCIDWTDPGKRIGDRLKPLADNTITRIQYGLDKYGEEAINPFIINDQQSTGVGHRVRSVSDRLPTIPTEPHFKLLMPQIIDGNFDAKPSRSMSVMNEMNTQNTHQRNGVLFPMPFIVKGENTQVHGNVRSAVSPMQTQCGWQTQGVVTPAPFIIEMNASGKMKPAMDSPTSTFTAGGVNHALCLAPPFLVQNKGESKTREITDATNSMTTTSHMGLIQSESWKTFITYYNGKNGASKITDAAGTVPTKERLTIVNYQKPNIEDCYYRMLKPHEIKLAMAFDAEYVVLGKGKDQVKQLGNAVTPPAMEWLVQQCVESLS